MQKSSYNERVYMSYKHEFLYPDYYPEFACKCGDCRATCCHGWGIALSRDEYFRVMSTDCSPELRRRLDVAFRPATDPAPTPERYVLISYNWLGKCPIQTDEGLCLLHRDMGEEAIPEICRRYPRCHRVLPIHECCASTACEYTLELLWRDTEPVRFITGEVEVYDEDFDTPAAAIFDASEYEQVRKIAFEIIADRSMSLDDRIAALARRFGAVLPYLVMPEEKAAELFMRLTKTSGSLEEISEEVEAYVKADSELPRFCLDGVSDIEIYIEKMFVNHLFYKAFPRSFPNSTPTHEIASLVALRGLHRFVSEAYLAAHGYTFENFVDVTAKMFRMVEHSRFDEAAAHFVLKE